MLNLIPRLSLLPRSQISDFVDCGDALEDELTRKGNRVEVLLLIQTMTAFTS